MKLFFHLFFCALSIAGLSGFNLRAQVTQPSHLVLLHNGEEYTGKRLLYISPILRTSEFSLDERKFESSEIAFFRNNLGYFANLNRIYSDRAERYAMRIKEGRISLFEEIDIEIYGGDELEGVGPGITNERLATGDDFQYFTRLNGPVQKANYRNLKLAMADYPESRREMNIYRNYRYLQVGMVLAGAGLITYEIMRQGREAQTSTDGAIRMTPMIALGVVIGGSSYFIERAKSNTKWIAVEKYNKAE